eukprot:CAMPEP_0171893398 /NCGR_PEP_ID=MMETSP0992-20121227/45858_1 /TAXON_ID=483369 /ORGANISM="non described non described, Strain CCMP2098" /LENGTH=56 /DNA_ID=CAMNT_0012521011 /DNA_START=1 /DNA_END=168 /DNA_ORIENTATION=+
MMRPPPLSLTSRTPIFETANGDAVATSLLVAFELSVSDDDGEDEYAEVAVVLVAAG